MTETAMTSESDRRFVIPEDLVCGGCLEQVRLAPPAYWVVADGLPVPPLSHQDHTALCADPTEVSR